MTTVGRSGSESAILRVHPSLVELPDRQIVIKSSERLEEFERQYIAMRTARLSYMEALALFAGSWRHALALNPRLGEDWLEDVQADIELARVLNGIPGHG